MKIVLKLKEQGPEVCCIYLIKRVPQKIYNLIKKKCSYEQIQPPNKMKNVHGLVRACACTDTYEKQERLRSNKLGPYNMF